MCKLYIRTHIVFMERFALLLAYNLLPWFELRLTLLVYLAHLETTKTWAWLTNYCYECYVAPLIWLCDVASNRLCCSRTNGLWVFSAGARRERNEIIMATMKVTQSRLICNLIESVGAQVPLEFVCFFFISNHILFKTYFNMNVCFSPFARAYTIHLRKVAFFVISVDA